MASGFYCAAPSCAYHATADSQYCRIHNGETLTWYAVERPGMPTVNVRAESQEQAERIAARR